jgi:hypothetical protein
MLTELQLKLFKGNLRIWYFLIEANVNAIAATDLKLGKKGYSLSKEYPFIFSILPQRSSYLYIENFNRWLILVPSKTAPASNKYW